MGNRGQLLKKNTISSVVLQMTTIICGLILPRIILVRFGTEINGLVNSVTQFLSVIAFLELGVGAVVKAALYKPLADKNDDEISRIIKSAQRFFRTIAIILVCYVVVLIFFYPYLVESSFDIVYTGTLITAMGISYFSQYYFGMVNGLLLTADQKGYKNNNIQTLTLILNTIACYLTIRLGASIQIVKLVTSMIFLIRPLYLYIYIAKNYRINKTIAIIGEPIKQKWNGLAQHIAAIVLDSTDVLVLSLFSTLSNVSIYSVYYMPVNGLKQLFVSASSGVHSLIGELLAKREYENLSRFFGWIEWIMNTSVTIFFGCCSLMIVPFVKIYTQGVNDVNYELPVFAVLITVAFAVQCLKLPYNATILAGGHFKQTQKYYVLSALLNVVFSVATVKCYGLIGVAIGTLIAMVYQVVWSAWYISKHLLKWPIKKMIKQVSVDWVVIAIAFPLSMLLKSSITDYLNWCVQGVMVLSIWILVSFSINLVFYKEYVHLIVNKIATTIIHKK